MPFGDKGLSLSSTQRYSFSTLRVRPFIQTWSIAIGYMGYVEYFFFSITKVVLISCELTQLGHLVEAGGQRFGVENAGDLAVPDVAVVLAFGVGHLLLGELVDLVLDDTSSG